MQELFLLPPEDRVREAASELMRCNERTRRFGLTLRPEQAMHLAERRFEALQSTGRVEFGSGILERLIDAFCDSPDIQQADYAETLDALQELFYALKNETMEQLSDDALLAAMRLAFDRFRGSLEALSGLRRDALLRIARDGAWPDSGIEGGWEDE